MVDCLCDKNLVVLNIIYIGYLQTMRIDFSQLDKEETQRSSVSTSLEGTFPQIWKHAFNKEKMPPIQATQQQQQSLSFSINYPYEVTRSLSPSAINKQLAYLKAKKILPTSTLRFIENTLHAQLERQNQDEQIKNYSVQLSPQKQPEKEKKVEKQSQTFDLKSKLKIISKNQNHNCEKIEKKKKFDHVKPKVYDIRPKEVREQRYRRQQNLDGVTLKPVLNYTMNSKTAKKVQRKRNHHFKTYQTNVFESLYYDAAIYSTKKQMQKMQIEQEESQATSRNTSRVKIYSTFEERLQTSIEKNAQRKKKAQNKLEFDLSTGQKYFAPNTARSKVSYFTHFRSLSPHRTDESLSKTCRETHHSKDYKKLNSSHQKTTFNNSYEETLNNSLNGKYKIIRKPLPRQNRLAELYANLLWSEEQLRQDILSDQERNILRLFLQQIKSHEQEYSRSISKQVFIAFFKEVYANLNLFDRSVLDNRLKAQKKIMNHHDSNKRNENQMQTMRKMAEKQKITSQYRLSHTHKHFFI